MSQCHESVFQKTQTQCNTVQHSATQCNTVQHSANDRIARNTSFSRLCAHKQRHFPTPSIMALDSLANTAERSMDNLNLRDLPAFGDESNNADIGAQLEKLADEVISMQHDDCSEEFSSSGSSATSTPHGTPVMAPRKDAGRCTIVNEDEAVQRATDNAAKRQAERSNGKGRRAGGGKGACPSAVNGKGADPSAGKDKHGGKRPRMIPVPPPPEAAEKKKKKRCAMMDREDGEYQPPPAKKTRKIRLVVERREAIPAAAAANDVNAVEAAKCKYCKCVPVIARTCFWGSCILCNECAADIDTSGVKCPCGCQYKGSDAVPDCLGDLFEANRVLDIPTCEHCLTTEFENLAFKQHVETCDSRPRECQYCNSMTDQLHQCRKLPCAGGKCEHMGYKHSKEPCTTRELYNMQQQQAEQIAE